MKIQQHISLQPYNTFGIDISCSEVFFISDKQELENIPQIQKALIIGGGSNILLTKYIELPVVVNQTKGIWLTSKDEDFVEVSVASGENWHHFVTWAIDQNFGGLENMSLIPGSVGAAPMQNIGAYGAEVKDVITYVKAINLENFQEIEFTNEACQFGYRESIFKTELKNKVFITEVGFKLTTKNHILNTQYGAIADKMAENGVTSPTIKDISNAVIAIRESKLPNPKVLGNAGSFFKNPTISKQHFEKLKQDYPAIVGYNTDLGVKVPAGWLIENAGWKGKRIGNTGAHALQALVLVNYGNASGEEIFELSEIIIQDIENKFGIVLNREVNVI